MTRADPRITSAVRDILSACPDRWTTGRELRALVEASGVPCGALRRIGEAVAQLLAEGLPIASSSQAGYRLGSVEDLRGAVKEIDRRILSTFARRKALARALAAAEGPSPQLRLVLGGVA